MEMILANGNKVKVTLGEIRNFITEMPTPIPNAYWRYSELLSEDEVMRFLAGESNQEELQKIARYLLIYTENLAFSAYLFNKAKGKPDQTKDFNIPAVRKLRRFYRAVKDNRQMTKVLARLVREMGNICLEIGADPL